MVTPEQSDAYTLVWEIDRGQTCAPSCTADDFKIDLLGPPGCAWNLSASLVFCRSFLDFHGLPNDEEVIGAVKKAFLTRVRTLKAKYALNLLQKHERQEVARKRRRYRRKYSVCCFHDYLLYLSCLIMCHYSCSNGD